MEEMFANVQEKFKTIFENERTSELWIFKSILDMYVFLTLWRFWEKMVFIYVIDLAPKLLKSSVWFESKEKGMIGIRKISDLNQEAKAIWNLFMLFESQDMWFESQKLVIQIRGLEANRKFFSSVWFESCILVIWITPMWFELWSILIRIMKTAKWFLSYLWFIFESEKLCDSNHTWRNSFLQNIKVF